MKLAIFDIDDTITHETKYLLRKAPAFLHKKGLTAQIVLPDGYSLDEIYGVEEQLKRKGFALEQARERAQKLSDSFWNRHFFFYNFTPIRPGVKRVIQLLKSEGYQICFLTLRGNHAVANSKGLKHRFLAWVVPSITKCMLRGNGIPYDKVIFAQSLKEKAEYIKKVHPDMVFEDQLSLLARIQSENDGIKGVCVTSSHNAGKELPANTIRINNFTKGCTRLWSMIDRGGKGVAARGIQQSGR